MKFFSSPFNQTTCGKIKLPAGNTGKMKLLLVDEDNNKCAVNFLHNFDVQLSNSAFFSTATSIINCDITPDHFVIYLEENNTYSWILENSIEVNIYDLTTGALLATKVFGTLDDLILLEPSNFIDKPSLVLSKCGYDSTINLNKSFIKVEFRSLCGDSVLPACCDQLPESVSISGYDILCIPLRENYEVPDFTTTTTTLPPLEDEIKILQQPYIIQSRDVEKYYLYAFIDTKYGNDFQYWWERSEDNAKWERITELKSSRAFSQISLEQVKEKDYFYRLYIHAPTSKISDSVFYDYIDYATTTTTTTTTTTIPPLPLSPPSQPLNFEGSGGGFRQTFLTWNEPDYDGRSDRTKYGLNITLHQQDALAYSVDIPPSSTSWYQDIESEYDGILLDYSLRAHNFFGYSPAVTVTGIKTLLLAPPTVVNFSVSAQQDPYRMELDWDTTGVNENYPLLGHTVKYRPSGSSSAYTVSSYDGTETQLTILDSNTFDNCETYEFLVTASNSIGESNPASGYARMAFLPSAPFNLDLQITDVGGGNIDLDFYWNPPIDSGRCEILNYVYQYREANDLDWSLPITVYTTGVQAESQPSGDYIFRVAAVNVVGTGNYAAYGDWVQVGSTITNSDFLSYDEEAKIANDASRISLSIYSGSSYRGYIYDFNGCSWQNVLNAELGTGYHGDSFLFEDNNSVAFSIGASVKIYDESNGNWTLNRTLTRTGINFSNLVQDNYNSSKDFSNCVFIRNSPSQRRYLAYWDGISSSVPTVELDGYNEIIDTTISDDGSTLCIVYLDSDYTHFYARFYSINELSLNQIGQDLELDDLWNKVEIRLSTDGSELLIISGDRSMYSYTDTYFIKYNESTGWQKTYYRIDMMVTYRNNFAAISSDLQTIALQKLNTGNGKVENIQVFSFNGNSWSKKGSQIITSDTLLTVNISNQGDVITFMDGASGGPYDLHVYRYAASDITLDPCIPGYNVSGAGKTFVNGDYCDTEGLLIKSGPNGNISISFNSIDNRWEIGDADGVYYVNNSSSSTPPTSGWTLLNAE